MGFPAAHGAATSAPDALEAVATLSGAAAAAVDARRYALVRARMATLLRVDDPWHSDVAGERRPHLPSWPTSAEFASDDRAVLAMTEQFVMDVAGVTDRQRDGLRRALGDATATMVNVWYAIDVELRLRAASRQLFGVDVLVGVVPERGVALRAALDRMTRDISRLEALDPLATELVRLRGARLHHCRMCKVLRHADTGGDEALFEQLDDYESGDFCPSQRVALRLTDAVLRDPGGFPTGLCEQARHYFSPAQVLEIVLDVLRNARNKVAVTNGTDGQGVGSGLTFYRTAPDGGFELAAANGSAAGIRAAFGG